MRYYRAYLRNWLREWARRGMGGVRFWWRTHRPVNPWQPGHSKIERMRALDREMTWVEDNSPDAETVVRVRIEG